MCLFFIVIFFTTEKKLATFIFAVELDKIGKGFLGRQFY